MRILSNLQFKWFYSKLVNKIFKSSNMDFSPFRKTKRHTFPFTNPSRIRKTVKYTLRHAYFFTLFKS